METISINKRYSNGKELSFKVVRRQLFGEKGYTWGIQFKDGRIFSLGMLASGRDAYRKKDFEVIYKSNQ